MNKVELQKIILEKIGSESEDSFSEFLKRVAEYLQGYKTLKLDGVGHFQLKKEPLSRMERHGEANEKNIIVFLPEGKSTEESLLSFEVNNDNTTSNEFNDSVFDIGVDKPTIISNSETTDEEVGNKILSFIESGNVLENYDILDDNSSSTETTDDTDNLEFTTSEITDSSIEDSSVVEDVTEVHINENFLNDSEEDNSSNDEFDEAPIDDNEIFADEVDKSVVEDSSNNITKDDFEEVSSNLETKITEDDVAESESGINIVTTVSEEFIAEDEVVEEVTETEEVIEESDGDKNPFDELDDYIKDETKDEAQEIIDEAPDEVEEEIEESVVAEQGIENTEVDDKKETEHKKSSAWYKNPILLISILAAVIAVVVIFLFWPSSTEPTVVDVEKKVEHSSENTNHESAKIDSTHLNQKNEGNDAKVKKEEQSDAEKLAEVKKIESENKAKDVKEKVKHEVPTPTKASKGGLYREIPNDQTVTQRIYTDGDTFTVQSSSWRSTSIAEREVSKLKKRGFDAFIVKVFIKSKGSTWNRVRIGYFNSRKEAEKFLQKNKI